MSENDESSGGGLGCVFVLILAVLAMPVVGLYLALAGEESEQKWLGGALIIVGLIVWAKVGLG